ncbi:MAG: APC family permease [Bacteroidota bacterium]
MTELKRTLSLTQCVLFGIGSILGAGIYVLVGKVAGWSGNMAWLAFLLASLTALTTAFSYAELSAMYPRSGGEYVYADKAFGQRSGIMLGSLIALSGIVTAAAVALGFAGYLGMLTGLDMTAGALGILLLLFLVNVSGIRESSAVNAVFTIAEALGLFLVIFSSLSLSEGKAEPAYGAETRGILTGASLAFFATIGFEKVVKLAEEAKAPERNIPRALFISTAIISVLYILVAYFSVRAVSPEELAASESPLATVVRNGLGYEAAMAISIIALFSTSNTVLADMLGSSRIVYHMGREIGFLKLFSWVSPGRQTPIPALLLVFVSASLITLIGNVETAARFAALFVFAAFVIIHLCVIALRVKEKTRERPYRMPVNVLNVPVISVAGILLTMILLGYNIYSLLTEA